MATIEANMIKAVEFRDPAPRRGGQVGPRGSKYDAFVQTILDNPERWGAVFSGSNKAASGVAGRLRKMYAAPDAAEGGELEFLVRGGEVFAKYVPASAAAAAAKDEVPSTDTAAE